MLSKYEICPKFGKYDHFYSKNGQVKKCKFLSAPVLFVCDETPVGKSLRISQKISLTAVWQLPIGWLYVNSGLALARRDLAAAGA